jgi:hypothetical protein
VSITNISGGRSAKKQQPTFAWHVIHAGVSMRDAAELVEAQISYGMRPYVVDLVSNSGKAPSLMNGWSEVRNWKKQLDEYGGFDHADHILHAHCFGAGMAGVRSSGAVVYDLEQFIEDRALSSSNEKSWLGRSFRAAEQFVMSRAGAVVVHSRAMEAECKDRGVAEDLFYIPHPVIAPDDLHCDRGWLVRHFGLTGKCVSLYCAVTKPEHAATVAKALSQASNEEPALRLFVHCEESLERAMRLLAQGTELEERLFFVTKDDAVHALKAADIVLAIEDEPGARPSGVTGLLHGATFLAADIACNREITPDGAGCLWFKQEDFRDLAHRAAFLVRNADFRRALAETGYNTLLTTRDAERIGHKYDVVYRHAQQKARRGDIDQTGSAIPLIAAKLSA